MLSGFSPENSDFFNYSIRPTLPNIDVKYTGN